MNKSLAANLISAAVIGVSFFLPRFAEQVRSVGFFALSGAVTNWLAVHMLFEKVPLLYGSGVVPNHFEDFKLGIKNLIMQQFFTEENMRKFLSDTLPSGGMQFDIEPALDAIDYDAAFSSLTAVILESSFGGMLNLFGGAAVLEGFREPFEQKIKLFVTSQAQEPEFQEALRNSIGADEDLPLSVKHKVELIVEARLNELTPQMVKEIVKEMIAKHLGWLVVWGGVFGGLIGLIMGLLPL
jgi:uncharacterized membrane-anchored protein YjiN (DUF445 family)